MNTMDNENMKTGDSDMGKRQGLIAVNDLTYTLEPDLSVAVNKTVKKHFFQSTKYEDSQRAICILNSGADYVDTRRSYLTFGVRLPFNSYTPKQLANQRVNAAGVLVENTQVASAADTDERADYFAFRLLQEQYGTHADRTAISDYTRDDATNFPTTFGGIPKVTDVPVVAAGNNLYTANPADPEYYIRELEKYGAFTNYGPNYGEVEYRQGGQTCGYFGTNGSACNLIEQITVSTRSGDPLCHLRDFGLMQNMLMPLQHNREWFENHGALMKYGEMLAAGITHQVSIPMYLLSPLFAYGRLMPSMLMSGLRIEIQFASASKAFMGVRAPGPFDFMKDTLEGPTSLEFPSYRPGKYPVVLQPVQSYVITNPVFHLASVQLSDSIQRALNEQSAQNGLEVVYCDYESNPTNLGQLSTNFNVEIRKSCSRALKAFARVLTKGTQGFDEGKCDSFRSEQYFPFLKYQWRLGSLYFPQQEVMSATNDRKEIAVQAYSNLLESVDKYHMGADTPFVPFVGNDEQSRHSVPLDIITGRVMADDSYDHTRQRYHPKGYDSYNRLTKAREYRDKQTDSCYLPGDNGHFGSYMHDQSTIGVSLERSNLFSLAGIPINNSRVLSFQCNLYEINAAHRHGQDQRTCHVFLKFVKLARIWLNNVEVEQ